MCRCVNVVFFFFGNFEFCFANNMAALTSTLFFNLTFGTDLQKLKKKCVKISLKTFVIYLRKRKRKKQKKKKNLCTQHIICFFFFG